MGNSEKKLTIVIMQPGYLPWLGFFELMHCSDIFVMLDDVQYDKDGWRNRNRIKTPAGSQWLTVPVHASGWPKISEVKIDNSKNWPEEHLRALELNYIKTPYFKNYFGQIQKILNQKWDFLFDLNMALIKILAKNLDLERKIIFASDLKAVEGKIERLIDICHKLGASVFYEPAGGKNYLEAEYDRFQREGIELVFQNFQCREYPQPFGEFIPNLSIVDLLFNTGEDSLSYIVCPNLKF